MKFDNEKLVIKIHVLKIVFAFIIALVLFIFFMTDLDDKMLSYTGISSGMLILTLVFAYLFFYFYHIYVRTSYIYYNDEGRKIILRFYLLRPLNPPKSSFEIPKDQFYKYTINRTSLREELIIYQKNGNKIFKYPPISLKGISKEDRDNILNSLNQFVIADDDSLRSDVIKIE